MAADIGSYWTPARLTSSGLVQYEKEEIQLYTTRDGLNDVEFGEAKATFTRGDLFVTTHRIVWMRSVAAIAAAQAAATGAGAPAATTPAWQLSLESVERVEQKTSLMSLGFGTPRVHVHLHEPKMVEYLRKQHALAAVTPNLGPLATSATTAPAGPPPVKSALPRYTRLVFRGEQPNEFIKALQSSLAAGAFHKAVPVAEPVVPSFKTTGAGISGLVREQKVRERTLDRTLEEAFGDLSALMANAKSIVDLAAKLSASSAKELGSEAARSEFDSMLTSMGILNPVTQQSSGSAYHTQLAREMADFLPSIIAQQGGMILLTDAYCLINRARGTQLISPQDCLHAAQRLSQIATPLRLQEYASGVKVIVADGAVQQVTARIRAELEADATQRKQQYGNSYHPLRDAPSLSPLQLSDRWRISIILAKEYLCVAEQQQLLCRDESIHGLTFCIHQF